MDLAQQKMNFSDVMDYIGEYLRKNDLVIVPKEQGKAEKLREAYSRKTSLSLKQIADAQIWGPLKKGGVKARVDKYLETGEIQPHEYDTSRHPYKIRRHAFERIGKKLGTL